MSGAKVVDWVSAAARVQFPQGMLIDGRQVGADSGGTFSVIGPRDGRAITSLPEAGGAELDQAVICRRSASSRPETLPSMTSSPTRTRIPPASDGSMIVWTAIGRA